MKKLIAKKGYTIEVDSWENDGDNSQTKSITVDTKEEAKAYYDLMQLCKSENNQPKGVIKLGNVCDEFSNEQTQLIINFLKENIIFSKILGDYKPEKLEDSDIISDIFTDITSSLLGSSEYYICRVMESCKVTYCTEDVYIDEEIIEF